MTIKLSDEQVAKLAKVLEVEKSRVVAALAEVGEAKDASGEGDYDPVAEGRRMGQEQAGARTDPNSLVWK